MESEIPDIRTFDQVKRHLVGPVLVPNRFDLHDEALSFNEVEASCHYYNKNFFGQCDINHAFDVDCARVIESYILEGDCTVNGQQMQQGTWMAKTEIDHSNVGDVIWDAIVSGELAGYSPEGGVYEHVIVNQEG